MKPANSPQIYIVILVMHNKIYVNVTIRKGITTPTLYLNHACTSFTHIHTLFIIVIVCCYSHKYTTQFSRFISKKFFLELLLQQAPVWEVTCTGHFFLKWYEWFNHYAFKKVKQLKHKNLLTSIILLCISNVLYNLHEMVWHLWTMNGGISQLNYTGFNHRNKTC